MDVLIHEAIRSGDVERVQNVLSTSPNAVRARDGRNRTPLHAAVSVGITDDIFQVILSSALEPSDRDAQDSRGRTPLHYAVESRRVKVVEALLRAGCSVDASFDGGVTALHLAARDGLYDIAVVLMAFGSKAHLELECAGQSPSDSSVEDSSSRGNDVSEGNDNGDGKASRGTRSPLLWAVCTERSTQLIGILVNSGASLQDRYPAHDMYGGKTALHVAALLGNKVIVEELLKMGAEVDARDSQGRKAIQIAEMSKHSKAEEVRSVLLSYASTRVVASGGQLNSRMDYAMLILGGVLGYLDMMTDIIAIYILMEQQHTNNNHSNKEWAGLAILSLILPPVLHAMLQACKGLWWSALRSILGLELAFSTIQSLRIRTRSSTFMAVKYLMVAFESIPQSMIQVTVLLARWQYWGARGSEYPDEHVGLLCLSIFVSLLSGMHTAVDLALNNEDSAWKGKIASTGSIACIFIFFFCDGYVHISSFAAFATVFRYYVFFFLVFMTGTVCLLLRKAFGGSRAAIARSLMVSPLLTFVDFPLKPTVDAGMDRYWIFFRVIGISSFFCWFMQILASGVASANQESEEHPFVKGTVYEGDGKWIMIIVMFLMFVVKMLVMFRFTRMSEMRKATDVKDVFHNRSLMSVMRAESGEIVMTPNPLSSIDV